jgi:hypothetical protein
MGQVHLSMMMETKRGSVQRRVEDEPDGESERRA